MTAITRAVMCIIGQAALPTTPAEAESFLKGRGVTVYRHRSNPSRGVRIYIDGNDTLAANE